MTNERTLRAVGALAVPALIAALLAGCRDRTETRPRTPYFDRVTLTVGGAEFRVVKAHSEREFEEGVVPLHDETPMIGQYQRPFRLTADRLEFHVFADAGERIAQRYTGSAFDTDLVFLDDAGRVLSVHRVPGYQVHGAANVTPQDARVPRQASGGPARYALRTPVGWAAEHGLAPGATVGIPESERRLAGRRFALVSRLKGNADLVVELFVTPAERARALRDLARLDDGAQTGRFEGQVLVFDRNENDEERQTWLVADEQLTRPITLVFMRRTVAAGRSPGQSRQVLRVVRAVSLDPGDREAPLAAAALPPRAADGGVGYDLILVVPDRSHETIGYAELAEVPLNIVAGEEGGWYGGKERFQRSAQGGGGSLWNEVLDAARCDRRVTVGAGAAAAEIVVDVATTERERGFDLARRKVLPRIEGRDSGYLGIYTAKPGQTRTFRNLFDDLSLGEVAQPYDVAFLGFAEGKVAPPPPAGEAHPGAGMPPPARAEPPAVIVHLTELTPPVPGWGVHSGSAGTDNYGAVSSGGKAARYVLWMPGGWFAAHGFAVGTPVEIPAEVARLAAASGGADEALP